MECEGSLLCLQEFTACPSPEPYESMPTYSFPLHSIWIFFLLSQGLRSGFFLWVSLQNYVPHTLLKNYNRLINMSSSMYVQNHVTIFIHSFIIFHKSIIGYRHHWMWNLSIGCAISLSVIIYIAHWYWCIQC